MLTRRPLSQVVRAFKPQLLALLQSRQVDLCFANEDEARELVRSASCPGQPGRGPLVAGLHSRRIPVISDIGWMLVACSCFDERLRHPRLLFPLTPSLVCACLSRDLDAGQGAACAAEAALDVLAQWCPTVVVMLGPRGCIARAAGQQVRRSIRRS